MNTARARGVARVLALVVLAIPILVAEALLLLSLLWPDRLRLPKSRPTPDLSPQGRGYL